MEQKIRQTGCDQQTIEAFLRGADVVLDSIREPLIVLDHALRVVIANRSFYRTFDVNPKETEGALIQALILTIIGVSFLTLGLLLLVLAGVYFLPPEWRVYGLAAAAAASILAGAIAFISLSRHLNRKQSAFEQSLAELKKDATCFSTGK